MQTQIQQPQITLSLPAGVPAPKFQLFQRVRVGQAEATIAGMQYVGFLTALVDDLDKTGWCYIVDYVYGATEQAILERGCQNNATSEEWESNLQPVEEA